MYYYQLPPLRSVRMNFLQYDLESSQMPKQQNIHPNYMNYHTIVSTSYHYRHNK